MHRVHQATTHYLGDAIEIRGDQLFLNIYAGSQRIATKAMGNLGELAGMAGSSTRIDRNIDLAARPTHFLYYALLFTPLFILASLRPVRRRSLYSLFPVEANSCSRFKHRIRPLEWAPTLVLRHLLKLHSYWQTYTRLVQESIQNFHYRRSTKIIFAICTFIFILQQPLNAMAEAQEPIGPKNDANYFVYHHGDHLGSSHIITEGKDETHHAGMMYKKGDILQRFEYAPFGVEKFSLNPNLSFDPSYTSQLYDIETGLYYYKSRYYNPVLGRFIQPDTIVPKTCRHIIATATSLTTL